ncbi:MAG: hypothetical protein WBK55_09660 [Alphaproteobacteria bacterium]
MIQIQTLNLLDILNQANVSKYGVSVTVPHGENSKQLRRKFYNFREQLRQTGNCEYDQLSFVTNGPNELRVIKRLNVFQRHKAIEVLVRPLLEIEYPEMVKARGKAHPGIGIS